MGSFIVRFAEPVTMLEPIDDSRLSERQRAALDYVRQHGSITTGAYGKLFSLSRVQAFKDLASMAESGFLERFGEGRSTRYVLASSDRVSD